MDTAIRGALLGLIILGTAGAGADPARELLYERTFPAASLPELVEDGFELARAYDEADLFVDCPGRFHMAIVHVASGDVKADAACQEPVATYSASNFWPAGAYEVRALAGGPLAGDALLRLTAVPYDATRIEERRVLLHEEKARLRDDGTLVAVFRPFDLSSSHVVLEADCAAASGAWTLVPGEEYITYVPPVEGVYPVVCDEGEGRTEVGYLIGEHHAVATFTGEPGALVTLRVRGWP